MEILYQLFFVYSVLEYKRECGVSFEQNFFVTTAITKREFILLINFFDSLNMSNLFWTYLDLCISTIQPQINLQMPKMYQKVIHFQNSTSNVLQAGQRCIKKY